MVPAAVGKILHVQSQPAAVFDLAEHAQLALRLTIGPAGQESSIFEMCR